jgi:hypothetical protein
LTQIENVWPLSIDLPHLLGVDLEEVAEIGANECSHLWISSIVRSAESQILSQIVLIPSVSNHGRTQICADLSYFSNILAALEIALDSKFFKILELMKMSPDDFQRLAGEGECFFIVSKMRKL